MPSPEANSELNGYLRTVHAGISDRIGQGILHQEYGNEYRLPELAAFDGQRATVFKAFHELSRYDATEKLHQRPKLILLPPSSLIDTQDEPRERFLERFSGIHVFDPDRLIKGVSDTWELAVTQGDWSESMAHKDFEPDNIEDLPPYVQHMRHLTPLGYVALGGDVDREERHSTYLLNEDGTVAYGAYKHAGTNTQTDHRANDGSWEPAKLIISAARPQKRQPRLGAQARFVNLPLRRRLTVRAGQAVVQ